MTTRSPASSAQGRVTSAIGTAAVPPQAADRSGLTRIDYADHFAIDTTISATPERYARAMFGDTPTPAERFIWRGLLRLRLLPGTAEDQVAGWLITERNDHWIRLATRGTFLSTNLIIAAADGRLSLTTLLHYDDIRARLIWPPLSAVHRRLAPGLLRGAATES